MATIEKLKQQYALLQRIDLSVNDKLTYAVRKNMSKIDAAIKAPLAQATEWLQDESVLLASVDEKGNLIEIDGKFSFSPENKNKINKRTKEVNEIFANTEVDFEGYSIDTTLPGFERANSLYDDYDRECLVGILV